MNVPDELAWLFHRSLNPGRRLLLAAARARHPGPKVLANSVQKAGTHMLMSCLQAFPEMVRYHAGVFVMGERERGLEARRWWLTRMGGGCFVAAHLPYSEASERFLTEHGFRTVLMIRDPRDVAVSFYRFALRKRRHPHHVLFSRLADDASRLKLAIAGDDTLNLSPVVARFRRMMPWLQRGSLAVRYEDLVGPQGGGTRRAQLDEVRRLAAHLEVELTEPAVESIASKTYDRRSRTFHKGKIGAWKECFTDEHRECFKRVAGSLLEELGYEGDGDW